MPRQGSRKGPHHSPRPMAHRVRPGSRRHHAAVRDGGHAVSVAGGRVRSLVAHRVQAGANPDLNLFSESLISPLSAAATTTPIGPNNAGPPRCTSNMTVDPAGSSLAGLTLPISFTLTPPRPSPSSVIASGGW